VCVSFLFGPPRVVWFCETLYTVASVPIASGAVGAHLPTKYVTVRCVYFFLPPAAAGAVVWFRRRRLAAVGASPRGPLPRHLYIWIGHGRVCVLELPASPTRYYIMCMGSVCAVCGRTAGRRPYETTSPWFWSVSPGNA